MKAMIFAAGMGTRLKPLTDTMPKALVPINGKPLLEHLILKMKLSGFDEIVVNVHHFADQIIDFLQANNNFGVHIMISDEREMLLDTGGGLRKAQSFFDNEPFLLHNVDVLSNLDFGTLMQAHNITDLATLVVSARNTQRYFVFDDEKKLCGWINKQTGEKRPYSLELNNCHEWAFSGIHVLSPQIFEYMSNFPPKFSMVDVYLTICAIASVRAYIPNEYQMMDVGKIDCLSEAQSFVLHSAID